MRGVGGVFIRCFFEVLGCPAGAVVLVVNSVRGGRGMGRWRVLFLLLGAVFG